MENSIYQYCARKYLTLVIFNIDASCPQGLQSVPNLKEKDTNYIFYLYKKYKECG